MEHQFTVHRNCGEISRKRLHGGRAIRLTQDGFRNDASSSNAVTIMDDTRLRFSNLSMGKDSASRFREKSLYSRPASKVDSSSTSLAFRQFKNKFAEDAVTRNKTIQKYAEDLQNDRRRKDIFQRKSDFVRRTEDERMRDRETLLAEKIADLISPRKRTFVFRPKNQVEVEKNIDSQKLPSYCEQRRADANLSKELINRFYETQLAGHRDLLVHGHKRRRYFSAARPSNESAKKTPAGLDMDEKFDQDSVDETPENEDEVRDHFNYYNRESNILVKAERILRKRFELARMKVQKALAGGKKQRSSQYARRSKINDVPEGLRNCAWDNVELVDVESVQNEGEQLTNVALFNIAHELVKKFNDEQGRNEVSIVDISFFDVVQASTSGGVSDVDPNHYHCFKDVDNVRVLIPILLTDGNQGHFILVEAIDMTAERARKIHVFDPLFNGQAAISSEQVKMVVNAIGNPHFEKINPRYARRSDIINQNDVYNCGLHLLQNLQAILAHPQRSDTSLVTSYPQEVKFNTLKEQRKLLAKMLKSKLVARDAVEERSAKRVQPIIKVSDEDEGEEQLDVAEMVEGTNLSTPTVEIAERDEKKCICSIVTENRKVYVPASGKIAVQSKCNGILTPLASLSEEKSGALYGCDNVADLILSRVVGEFDVQWDQPNSVWAKSEICGNHCYEFSRGYLDRNSKLYSHIHISKKNLAWKQQCSWPDGVWEAHSKARPLATRPMMKEDAKSLLESKGFLIPPGLPVCRPHMQMVDHLKETKCSSSMSTPVDPASLIAISPSIKNWKRLQTLPNRAEGPAKSTSTDENEWNKTKESQQYLAVKSRIQLFTTREGSASDDVVTKTISNVEKIVDEEFKQIVGQMKKHMTADVVRLENETEGHYVLRLLGHVKFHLCDFGDKSPEALDIVDVYRLLHRRFMGFEDEAVSRKSSSISSSSSSSLSSLSLSSSDRNKSDDDCKEEDQPIDQYVPGSSGINVGDALKVYKKTCKRMDERVERKLDDDIVDIHGQELRDAQQDSRDVAKKITKIRLCTSNCPVVNEPEAIIVKEKLLELDGIENSEDQNSIVVKLHDETPVGMGSTVKKWLELYQSCYQGLRSLNKRLVGLERLTMVRGHIESAKRGSLADVDVVINMDFMPYHLIMKFNRLYADKKPVLHHTESEVRRKFGKHDAAFKAKMRDMEDAPCDICTQYTARSDVTKKNAAQINPMYLLPSAYGADEYNVCRMCWREIKQCKIPHGALVNGMECDKNPDVLRGLNPIERMLIQRVRPIQNIFHLRDIGGRKTAMKGTKGVLVLVPVAVKETMEHVGAVLPNADKMLIRVLTSWGKVYLLSMPKIVDALSWLKKNNPHYADITINEQFSFEMGKTVLFEKEDANDDDVEDLILRRKAVEDDHLLTQANFEIQPLKEVIPTLDDNKLAVETWYMKKDKYRPLSVDQPNIDEKVLPALHPKGRYGFSHPRKRPVTMVKYMRHRILQKDRSFAQNPNWYTLMYGLKSQKAITSILGVQARVKKGTVVSDLKWEDPAFTSTVNSITAGLRGSPAYWKKCRLHLRAHVEMHGNPTFFLTLNSNEKGWLDLHELYSRITGRKVDENNIQAEIARDPAVYSRYWKRRVNAFFKEVLLVENGPLGTVNHHFRRVEYQHRGTQHVHCLLWTLERPAADAKPSEITDFIDKYVTARLPSAETEPELNAIIESQQKHWRKHSKTCLRITKYRGKILKRCRFDFPRPELRRTTYHKEKSAILLPGLSKREYFLARDESDKMINDYNAAISLIWNGNTDVQVITASSAGVCNYVSAYTTKGEKAKKVSDAVEMKIPDVSKVQTETFKSLVNVMNNREVGSLELIDDLCGHRNFEFDRGHTFIPTDRSDKRIRTLKPASVLEKAKPTDSVYAESMLDKYYPDRAATLRPFSLFNIMTNFDVVASFRARKSLFSKKKDIILEADEEEEEEEEEMDEMEDAPTASAVPAEDTDYHYSDKYSPLFEHAYIENGKPISIPGRKDRVFRKRRRTIAYYYLPELDWSDEIVVEDFFRRLCVMFIPWQDEELILENSGKDSYLEAFMDFQEKLAAKSENAANDLQKIVANFLKLRRQDRVIAQHLDAMKKAANDLNLVDQDFDEEIEVQKRVVDEERHESAKKGMNVGQKQIFDKLIGIIEKQEVQQARDREGTRLYVSGTAGVGKSFLINCLADELTLRYTDQQNQGLRPAVLIAAPTGLAAIGVKGSTIHTLFNIEVQHGRDSPFAAMRDNIRDMKRALFSNVKLIIIDEVSMCSSITIMKMHYRLQEILGSTGVFGNANIVAFGDLLQLPPVLAPRVFEDINPYQMRHVFGAMSMSVNLFSAFEFHELEENMRQKGDLEYADIMGRARLQALTAEDIDVLSSRLITKGTGNNRATYDQMAEYFVALQKEDPGALALFATNAESSEFNGKVMQLRKMEVTRIVATETAVASAKERFRGKNSRTQKIWQRKEFSLIGKPKKPNDAAEVKSTYSSPNIAGGLPLTLDVAVNARVMLRRNLDTSKGLVNGATGTLTMIEKDSNNCVKALMIRFDKCDFSTRVERMSVYYNTGFEERRCRNQFPIVMAFGATIHKSQGLTLDNCLVSTRNIFAAGQFFVAASRVRNLDGLHLADFHAEKVLVDTKSLIEYNRLRALAGLPGYRLPTSSTTTKPGQNNTRKADGNVVVMVGKTGKDQRRKVRTFVDNEGLTDAEIKKSIPILMETKEFVGSEKQMVHAVLLCVVMMTKVRRGLLQLKSDSRITFSQLLLSQLMEGGSQCVDYLMRNVRRELVNPKLMIEKCFEFLPDELKKVAQRALLRTDKCSSCHHRISTKTLTHVIEIDDLHQGNIEKIIDELYGDPMVLKERCGKCHDGKVVRTQFLKTDSSSIEYTIVVLNSRKNRFDRLKQDGSFFLNDRWQCIAMVQNLGMKEQLTCVSQPDGGYLWIKENEINTVARRPPFVNMQILVFKLKPYERVSKTQPADNRFIDEVPRVYPELDDNSEYEDEEESGNSGVRLEEKMEYSDDSDGVVAGEERVKLLQLVNTGTDCFVTSSLNLLHSMSHLRHDIVALKESFGMMKEVRSVFLGVVTNSSSVRKEMKEDLQTGQHDATDALDSILDKVPNCMQESYLVTRKTVVQCSAGCEETVKEIDHHPTIVWLQYDQNVASTICNIETVNTKTARCERCNKGAVKQTFFEPKLTVRNILVSRPYFQNNTYILPDVDSTVALFGRNWRVRALVSYRPDDVEQMGSSGHWVVWTRTGSLWAEIDDHRISVRKSINSEDLKYAVLYNLEKV